MNLYLVELIEDADYGETEAVVCCAHSENEAIKVHVREDKNSWKDSWTMFTVEPTDLKVTKIGIADEKYTKPTVIVMSYIEE